MSFGGASKAQGKSHTFTNLELNGGYDADCAGGPRARGVDLLVQGGGRIKKTLVVGNLCVEGIIIGDIVGNTLISELHEAEPGQGISVFGNLNMLCGSINDLGHLYVGNLHGSCPLPQEIQVHNNFHMLDTDPIIGGKITWEAGIEIGSTDTFCTYNDSIAMGKSATTPFGNSTVIGHSATTVGHSSFTAGAAAFGSEGSVVLGHMARSRGEFPDDPEDAWYNVVAGQYAYATQNDGVVIGRNAGCRSSACIAMGVDSNIDVNASHSISLGRQSAVIGSGSEAAIAIGSRSRATALHTIAIGGTNHFIAPGSEASAASSIAIGSGVDSTYRGAQSTFVGGIAIGSGTTSYGSVRGAFSSNIFATAIGPGSQALGQYTNAIGWRAEAHNKNGIAIGTYSKTTGYDDIVIGRNAETFMFGVGYDRIAIGRRARVNGGYYGMAIGRRATTVYSYGVAVGSFAESNGPKGIAIGSNASTGNYNGITVIGYSCISNGVHSIAVGYNSNTLFTASKAITIGSDTLSHGNEAIVIGATAQSTITASKAIAIGSSAVITGNSSIAIGPNSSTLGYSSIAMGENSSANGTDTMALGRLATAGFSGSIAIGTNITTTAANGIFLQHRLDASLSSPAAWIGNELVDVASSQRFKQNIRSLENVDEKFAQLRPVRFNAKPGYGDPEQEQIGLIAEELYELFPEFVVLENNNENNKIPRSIAFDRLVAIAIKEILYLREQIHELQTRIPK